MTGDNNKYYTPNIEEFYVGFEYESRVISSNQELWGKTTYELPYDNFYGDLVGWISTKSVRVKYLDKEDIESLGWKQINKEVRFYELGVFTLLITNISEPIISIDKLDSQIYRGSCKNKSELKRLMKQLSINE